MTLLANRSLDKHSRSYIGIGPPRPGIWAVKANAELAAVLGYPCMEGVDAPLPSGAPPTLANDNVLENTGGDENVSRTEGAGDEGVVVTDLIRKGPFWIVLGMLTPALVEDDEDGREAAGSTVVNLPRVVTGGVGPRILESDLDRLCSVIGGNDWTSPLMFELDRDEWVSIGDLKGSGETDSICVILLCLSGWMVT